MSSNLDNVPIEIQAAALIAAATLVGSSQTEAEEVASQAAKFFRRHMHNPSRQCADLAKKILDAFYATSERKVEAVVQAQS